MARWRLTQKHYLNIPGSEWEYSETDRTSGRQARHRFVVPALLDPDSQNDKNREGDVVVCYEGKGQKTDITFLGDPTPDMEPMDDEAEAISAALRPRWIHPIDSLSPTGDYSGALLQTLTQQLEQLIAKQPVAPVAAAVSPDEFNQLKEMVAGLAEQNATLKAQLEKTSTRRSS